MSKNRPHASACTAAAVLLGCLAYSGQAQSQGVFEFLFGGERSQPSHQPQPQPQAQPYGAPSPLQMRVNPRRDAASARFKLRPEVKGKLEAKAAEKRSRPAPASKLATPIDPKTNPNWHLIDPTLKRGDVVVLKGQILVYDGRNGPASRDDFTALKQSKLLSPAEREQIEKIAGLPASVPGVKQTDASSSIAVASAAAGPATVTE